jgi:hypothetical protein
VTDQSLIEVHAYSLGGYIDNGRVYAIERVERTFDGGLASGARDFGYRNDRCAHRGYLRSQRWPYGASD